MAVLNFKIYINGPKADELVAAVPPGRYYQAVEFLRRRAQVVARDVIWSTIREMASWSAEDWQKRCGDEGKEFHG